VNLHNSSAGTIRASLRYPAFRWLLSGLAVSQTGDWLSPAENALIFDGWNLPNRCYIEMGEDTVGTVDANFLSGPAPTALFTPPSLEGAEDKRRFAAFRRDRWFGPGSGESLPDGTTPDSPSPHEESHDHNLA
jgi:hypothetical protein